MLNWGVTLKFILESIEIIEEEWRPKQKLDLDDIIPISAITGHGTDHLKKTLRQLIDYHTELKMKEEIIAVKKGPSF